MMRFTMHIQFADGAEVTSVASVPDLLAFERQFDKPITEFGSGLKLEWILWLAWNSLRRSGKAENDFDTWVDTVTNITVGDSEGDAIVPLESNQLTGQ